MASTDGAVQAGHWNGDEFRWRLKAPTAVPTIAVSDEGADVKKAREEKIKTGARVVPFGFARALPEAPRAEGPPPFIAWDEV